MSDVTHGFRAFRVSRKITESSLVTSFYLEPVDGEPVWPVLPGQYLTLRVPQPEGALLKTYSVSSAPTEKQYHRISVKREAGQDGNPDGVGSCWLHDSIHEGDVVEVAAPRGAFVLDETVNRPVLLMSGGVGLTPMVSMLHALKETDRDVFFLHACENGDAHSLKDEVQACVSETINSLSVYQKPTDADRAAQSFDGEGFIDAAFMRKHIPIGDYDAYICGPTPFMVAMYQLLQSLGVPKSQISYEFFGKAASLEELVAQAAKPVVTKTASRAAPAIQALTFLTDPDAWAETETGTSLSQPVPSPATPSTEQTDVTFQKSGKGAAWDGTSESLLTLAENAGLDPEFSCRAGICNSCKCKLVSGEIEYFEEPLIAPASDEVLICCARPKGPVVIDI